MVSQRDVFLIYSLNYFLLINPSLLLMLLLLLLFLLLADLIVCIDLFTTPKVWGHSKDSVSRPCGLLHRLGFDEHDLESVSV